MNKNMFNIINSFINYYIILFNFICGLKILLKKIFYNFMHF